MAKGLNKVMLIGHLGANPEVRYSANGMAIVNVNIATNSSTKDQQTGQWQEVTEWHRVVLFGKLAEVAKEYLHKGSQVYIEGRIQTKKWQDKNGQDRWTTEIIANEMQMLGGRSDAVPTNVAPTEDYYYNADAVTTNVAPTEDYHNAPAQKPTSASQPKPTKPTDDFDDDIPF